MPGTNGYSPEQDSDLWKANENAGATEIRTRREANKKAWNYYGGKHKSHLKVGDDKKNYNVTLNKVGQLVDAGVSSLLGTDDNGTAEGVRFNVVDEPGERGVMGRVRAGVRAVRGQPNPAQEYLDQVWAINLRALIQQDLALNGGVTGHCFVRIVPDGIYYWPSKTKVARLINLDPNAVTVFWDASDISRVLFYRLEFGDGKDARREDIVRQVDDNGADLGGWTIYRYAGHVDGKTWTRTAEPERWAFDWSPIVDWKNLPHTNRYYGANDIGIGGQLNDAMNFTASNVQKILSIHAHPKMVGTGFEAKEIEPTAIDDFWAISNAEATLTQLEMVSDLSSSMMFLQLMGRTIFEVGRETDPQSVQDKLGDLTNFGLRVLNGQMLAKTGIKRQLYGSLGWTRINQALLDLAGQNPATEVVNVWPDALPTNQLEEAQALDVDRRHGASEYSYLERRGYSPDDEAARRQLEAQQQTQINVEALLAQSRAGGMF